MRRALQLALSVVFLTASLWLGERVARAEDANALYQARTIVTGQEEPSRSRGFAECLRQVLVKVSGDPRLADDPAVASLAGHAADYVSDFRYHDRMSGIPVHDEQGTRDRPHDLFVRFAPEKIDAALRGLGQKPWTERPRLLMIVRVDNGAQTFMLAEDGPRGRDMREALAAAAERFGLDAVLPAALGAADGAGAPGQAPSSADVEDLTRASGADLAVVGNIAWNTRALGWSAAWGLDANGQNHRWDMSGASFDAAFRSALGGAAQALSGHGEPGR